MYLFLEDLERGRKAVAAVHEIGLKEEGGVGGLLWWWNLCHFVYVGFLEEN